MKTHILSSPPDPSLMRTMARGSVANTIRGLSAGFGVTCGILGACGDDEQGRLFGNKFLIIQKKTIIWNKHIQIYCMGFLCKMSATIVATYRL